jgi:hypothetical protein
MSDTERGALDVRDGDGYEVEDEQITLARIVGLVDRAYSDDGVVGDYFAKPKGQYGDTLALFLVRELSEVYEEAADRATNLHLAADAVRTAIQDLEAVLRALENA